MSWATAGSAIFRQFVADVLSGTADIDLKTGGDDFFVALYNNTTAPDKDVSAANSCYNAGQWVLANEVSDTTHWLVGGEPGAGMAITTPSTGVIMFDMDNTASEDSNTTLSGVYGSLLYDGTSTTPDDQGVCFNYFGGSNSVAAGTLTIVWHANGLFRITV